MFNRKTALLGLLVFLFLASVVVVAIYFSFLTPDKRAAAHLQFVHKSIAEMHPAAVDPDNTEFRAWFITGYDQAKALLPQVHSYADEQALLTFYFAGYRDSHLAGFLVDSPFSLFESGSTEWMGWVLKATSKGYEVAYSLDGEAYPEVGSQLLSCDGQVIDSFLQNHYAPFVDRRWHLLNARDKVAKSLTQKGRHFQIFNRPNISSCVFRASNGEESILTVSWQKLGENHQKKIDALNYKPYSFPSVNRYENNLVWINVSDFELRSPEAYQYHQQLLEELQKLQGDETLVFDLRLNGGGNSEFGNQIFAAAFGKGGFAFAEENLSKKTGPIDALYRPSWSFYWSRDYAIKQLQQAQGNDSAGIKWMTAINLRMKKALENNESHFSQREALAGLMDAVDVDSHPTEQNVWNYRGRVIVLTSKRCVSSCLNFMDLLKQIPGVQHWGEQTNADTAYTEVAEMWHDYHGDPYKFFVPVKQWNNRLRRNNEPYTPDLWFEGNIYDDAQVEFWVQSHVKPRMKDEKR